MSTEYSVKLSHVMSRCHLEAVYLPVDAAEITITSSQVSRPGLQLAGFYEFFDEKRMQIIGKSEYAFLSTFTEQRRKESLEKLFLHRPAAIVVARELDVFPEMIEFARRYECALLSTKDVTSEAMAMIISTLNVELAPRITRHGVLVEVYGEGILLLGESGVGKSETAMELVKRGHRLIADDAVEIRRVSARTLVGSSPENIRHFMELRGIGIINVHRIFGIGAVKVTQQIDLLIQLEQWDSKKAYDRMGIENEYTNILGNNVPLLTIPIKPGRNLAIIIEVAAMNHRQKEMGYNAAHELLTKLGMADDLPPEALNRKDWYSASEE